MTELHHQEMTRMHTWQLHRITGEVKTRFDAVPRQRVTFHFKSFFQLHYGGWQHVSLPLPEYTVLREVAESIATLQLHFYYPEHTLQTSWPPVLLVKRTAEIPVIQTQAKFILQAIDDARGTPLHIQAQNDIQRTLRSPVFLSQEQRRRALCMR